MARAARVLIGVPTTGARDLHPLLSAVRDQAPTAAVVVALNGADGLAAEAVASAADRFGAEVIRTEPGYVHPRNALLDAAREHEFIVFFDDDQLPSSGWLEALTATADAEGADAVFGPVIPVVPAGAWARPEDLRRAPVGDPRPLEGHGYSGNTLIRVASLLQAGLRFDARFNRTGGEDAAFFRSLAASGARLWLSPSAVAFETVDPDRLTARGRFARGHEYSTRLLLLSGRSRLTAWKRVLRGVRGLVLLLAGAARGSRPTMGRGLFDLGFALAYFTARQDRPDASLG